MRIAILLNGRFPTEKAYGIQVLAMARGFAQAGAAVAVIYPRRSSDVPKPEDGIEFIPFGPRMGLIWPGLFPLLRAIGAMTAVRPVQSWKPDIVLINDPLQADYLAPYFPVAWDLHDTPNLDSFLNRLVVRGILRRARCIVSTNQLKLDALKRIGSTLPPTIVLPNPVSFHPSIYRSIDRFKARSELGIAPEERAVVYAGQLYDWKGVDTLIVAAAFSPNDVRIHIVGGLGADLERCKKLAASLPATSAKVIFHGQQPSEAIPMWLRAANIVTVPNSGKFEISRRDTNPLKLYEALAAEAAILASDLPTVREAVGDSAAVRFVKPDDAQAWGQAIGELVSDAPTLDAMRKAASSFHLMSSQERAHQLMTFFGSALRDKQD